jgi:hypothetical protein
VAVIKLLDIVIDAASKPFDLERIRRNIVEALHELQALPLAGARVLTDKTLTDGVATPIAHGQGRPVHVIVSSPRGAVSTGRIEEVRDGSHDRKRYVVLKATGWGAPVTVDVVVFP